MIVVYAVGFEALRDNRFLAHLRGNAPKGVSEVREVTKLHDDGINVVCSNDRDAIKQLLSIPEGQEPRNLVILGLRENPHPFEIREELLRFKRTTGSVWYIWDFLRRAFPEQFAS